MKGILFLNRRAGSLSEPERLQLEQRARDADLHVVDVSPDANVHAEVRDALQAGVRTFVVAGGDGSLHHVIQPLVGTDGILGIIPTGTFNHLARDLKLPMDWRAAFDIAVRGNVTQIDVGLVNGRYFLNSVMLGIYPSINEYRERFRSTHTKWRAYVRALRLAMRQFRHVSLNVELDGDRFETIKTQLFAVSINSYDLSQVGVVSLKTSFEDGRLTVYSLSFMNRMEFIRAAGKYFRGRIEEVDGFRRVRTRRLRITAAHRMLRVSVDGELIDMTLPLQIAAVPASLLVRVG